MKAILAVPDRSTEDLYGEILKVKKFTSMSMSSNEVEALLPELVFHVDDIEAYEKRHPLPTCASTPTDAFKHSPDFRSVNINGRGFSLTPKQAQVIEVLWNAYSNGTPEVGQAAILEEVSPYTSTKRLKALFKGNEDAWDGLVEKAQQRKGMFRLKI
jgi:hypothetical protein